MWKQRSALYLIPLLLAAAAAGYLVSRQLGQGASPALQAGTAMPAPRTIPAFALEDHTGAAFGNAQLVGAPTLLFFGFTHCPDVCPTTLALMMQLAREPALGGVRAVFVTVDPERDDRTALGQYVAAFGERLTGLRGDARQLAPLLEGLGVAHAQVPLPGGGYTVDHSAALYYLNARGQWSAAFTPPFDYPRLREDIATLVASHY
jgi:protein SCO1/2